MKRIIAVLGTLLITIIVILSGSAVAQWTWADHYEPYYTFYCTDPHKAEDRADAEHATVGQDDPEKLGQLTLDFDDGTINDDLWIPNGSEFRVWACSGYNETYIVNVLNYDMTVNTTAGNGWDTECCDFTAPSSGGPWRYVMIIGTSGGSTLGDPVYGPEVDAVGWE